MLSLRGTAFLLVASASLLGPGERVHSLADFPEQRTEIRAWMKRNDWGSKRNDPRNFELAEGRLHLVSRDDSVLIGTKQGMPLDPETWPRLRFRLRVDELPSGTNLSRKSGDDAAFRIYVAFDRGGTWFTPPNTIAYTWTENLAPETLIRSAHFKRLRYLSVGKGLTDGRDDGWVTVERNLLEDYRRVFGEGEEVPQLVGFMLKCDTNNTETSASAWLSDLELVAAERTDR